MIPLDATRKVKLVRKLVSSGHGQAVSHLLHGVSKYSVPANAAEIEYPLEFENRDSKGFHLMTWVHAHLEFTAKFGCLATEGNEGKLFYFAHHAEYEEWLRYGAPGLRLEELEACAKDLCKPEDGT